MANVDETSQINKVRIKQGIVLCKYEVKEQTCRTMAILMSIASQRNFLFVEIPGLMSGRPSMKL